MDRALLVGINKYPTAPLNGCVNDIVDMAGFLVDKLSFGNDNIRLLVNERATTDAIIERLGWLLTGVQSGDRVLFYYSGHGVQLPTRNPQGEVDGLDEAICPVDFDWTDQHAIRDKDFHRIFSAVPAGVEFVWVSDSCHSADLSREFLLPEIKIKTIIPPADIQWRINTAISKKVSTMGFKNAAESLNVALVSGCKSDQTSADATFNARANGALSYFLLLELKKAQGLSKPLNKIVENVNNTLRQQRYEQQPQIEGSMFVQNRSFLQSGS
ncbi:MAG: hypothetical protein JWQ34_3623 [Mucilaginibacter sp.]|uniref:caspase family protein n=1 Tax=Mucilaginibacter sp. TaxID=1882438 RepID=UPI0026339F05|nr:caspase family protein [Mucilaginibacter sp.]MDB5005398.1 hypothetical protein [Mucilaginibacter sp.]